MLEKLKDIFYDKNDIIVALALVVIGAFVISHQVDSIMSYPEQLADQLQQEQLEQEQLQQEQESSSAKPDGEGEATGTETPEPQTPEIQEPPVVQEPEPQVPPVQEPSTSNEFKTAVDRTVEIPSGAYSQKIAQILADAGVVPSTDAFLKAVNDAGLETKLKAGTFKIPAGSTLNDVVKIVTK